MSSEAKDILRDRLEQNYQAYMEALQKKTPSELITLASEITAVQQIHEELLKLQEESNQLMEAISKNMKEMGI